jgi:hypothetical protein
MLGTILIVIVQNSMILLGIPTFWQGFAVGLLIIIGTGVSALQVSRAGARRPAFPCRFAGAEGPEPCRRSTRGATSSAASRGLRRGAAMTSAAGAALFFEATLPGLAGGLPLPGRAWRSPPASAKLIRANRAGRQRMSSTNNVRRSRVSNLSAAAGASPR